MFTPEELSLLQLNYFKPIICSSDVCELQSKNGDHWMILKVQAHVPKKKLANIRHFNYTFQLYHKPVDNKGFHLQGEHYDLLNVILEIIDHDDYRLKNKGKTYFDEVVEMYG